jgi:UDP-glucose 4-epimerase
MRKILVTGSQGYIGRHLVQMLKKNKDISVHCLDKNEEVGPNRYQLDIRLAKVVKETFEHEHYDSVIHLAALVQVGESLEYPTSYYNTNINGTQHILRNVKADNFIFASTGAAENPISPYGISKRVAEDIIREMRPDATIFRFYNVIGSDGFEPTNPDGLFYNLIQAKESGKMNIYGNDYNTSDGTCVREYVHVNDICNALIMATEVPSKNHIENLAYGDTKTVKEIVEIFKEVNGVEFEVEYLPRRDGDLEACYLTTPSEFMKQNYTYEEMLRYNEPE